MATETVSPSVGRPNALESLSLDELVTEYQAVIDELIALDCVPARPDDADHKQRLERLYIRAGECSMEMRRRARYMPQLADEDAAAEAK